MECYWVAATILIHKSEYVADLNQDARGDLIPAKNMVSILKVLLQSLVNIIVIVFAYRLKVSEALVHCGNDS